MSNSDTKLQCYNRSCGELFDPDQNTSESCSHHPGFPVFHDAYKKWSCCDKKTTDFTEFLNIKGCTKSYHSNVKPAEPPKPANQNNIEEVQCIPQPLNKKEVIVRPDADQPLLLVPSSVGASLKPLLDKLKNQKEHVDEKESDMTVQLNTPCQNKGCREVYKGEKSNEETCLYHKGVPVFHEGMKYWSCCVKRTTDFNSFLEQVGCTVGKHKWHKDNKEETKTQCRYDWHQTGNSVVISIYSKCPLPDMSSIKANPVKLHIQITFGEDRNVFEEEIVLFGVIDVSSSLVTYLGSKVEIKLKKAHPLAWKTLELKKVNVESVPDVKSMTIEDDGDIV